MFCVIGGDELRTLDVGCGQGRDAIFLARLGHRVAGVDLSPDGIAELNAIAQDEGVPITSVVADVVGYEPQGMFTWS